VDFKSKMESLLRKVREKLDNDANSPDGRPEEQTPDGDLGKAHEGEDVSSGDIRISDDEFYLAVSRTALEVPGVVGMAGDLSDDMAKLIGKERIDKGIKIDTGGKLLNITVYLEVEYGTNIPELALTVQSNIKHNIQELTGYEVQCVNVHVEGIVKKED